MSVAAGVSISWPRRGDVHLWFPWRQNQDAEIRASDGLALLAEDEIIRLNAFKRDTVRQRYLLGRSFLRQVLSGYLDIHPRDIKIYLGANGKPYLAWPQTEGLDFNLSHDGHNVALAVVQGAEVGLDIMAFSRADAALRISKQFFSETEKLEIGSAKNERALFALKLLMLKESVVKAVGTSIWHGLSKVAVSIENEKIRWLTLPPKGERADWILTIGCYREQHMLALACRSITRPQSDRLTICSRYIGQDGICDAGLRVLHAS